MGALERQGSSATRAAVAFLIAALILAMGLAVPARVAAATASGANGTSLTVTPDTIDDLTGQVLVTVSGSGYSTTANSGFGVYVSFGPQPTAGDTTAFTDATRYYDGGPGFGTIWVRNGTPAGANQAQLNPDGTFSIQVAVKATYTGANGTSYDGTSQTLGVLTYAAHGTEAAEGALSQVAFVPVAFEEPDEPATAPAAPAAPTAASAGASAIDVSWTAPNDGGSPITGYTVTVRNGAGTSMAATATVGAVTSTQVTGLNADTSYNVVVNATNAVGTSPNSAASAVVRTAPTSVAADFSGLRWKISHQVWTSGGFGIKEVDGVSQTTDGFVFPSAAPGTYDPATGETHATFSGTVSAGNTAQGNYRVWWSSPSLDVDASGNGVISADVSYRIGAGAQTTPVRVAVATFTVAPSEISVTEDHVVIQTPLDATFSSAFIAALDPQLRGHFQPTGVASDPLKAPAPIAAGFDAAVVDDPLSGEIVITTEVVETGALVLSIDDTQVTLTSPTLDANGDLTATGDLSEIRVVDLRSSNPGWDVTGQVGDFAGPGGASIDGAGLSWSPEVVSSSAGQTVTAGSAGGGLKDGQVLGSAAAGQGRGSAVLGGGLVLEVPTSTPTGTYSARLTLTAI